MPLIQNEKLSVLDSTFSAEDNLKVDLRKITEQQNKLLEQQNQILTQLSANQKQQGKKDFWDRVAAIAPILSGTIIALGGAYFTTIYNEQQLKLQEVQTIERFIPHLLGDEKSKRAAVLAISSLGNAKLAARVAAIFASPGTVSALESMARNDHNSSDRGALNGALDRALDNMAEGYRVEKKYEDAIATYKKVLALREQAYGSSSSRVVPGLNRLAALYKVHGDYSEAQVLLKRSVDIQKSEFGKDSMQHAEALRKLASLYAEQGQDSKSRELANEAAAIEQRVPAASKVSPGTEQESDESFAEISDSAHPATLQTTHPALQSQHSKSGRATGFLDGKNAESRPLDRATSSPGLSETQNDPTQQSESSSAETTLGTQKSSEVELHSSPEGHGRVFSPRKLWESQEAAVKE